MTCTPFELGRITPNPHWNTLIQIEVCLSLLQFHSLKAGIIGILHTLYLKHQVLPLRTNALSGLERLKSYLCCKVPFFQLQVFYNCLNHRTYLFAI